MTLKTRKPTGRPAWPMILLAGAEKAGKSWAAAVASSSDMIGRTFWLGIGEDDPDEYGPLGRFEIVEQDGTHRALVESIEAIGRLDDGTGKPDLIVVDSMSMVWAMLTDEAQALANRRATARAQRQNKPAPADDVAISMDLWNRAAKRWRKLMDALRAHRGPVILTARLSQVTVLDQKGDPIAGEKEWKIDGHKTLPYDVTAIVQLRSRTEHYLTGVKSIRWTADTDALAPLDPAEPNLVESLWKQLGLADADDRVHNSADGARSVKADDDARHALLERLARVGDMARLDTFWQEHHGEPLAEASDMAALAELVERGEQVHAERAAAAARDDDTPPPAADDDKEPTE